MLLAGLSSFWRLAFFSFGGQQAFTLLYLGRKGGIFDHGLAD